ncbi:MAG: CarD family transcriptional regulator [Eubacteriales bacterium]
MFKVGDHVVYPMHGVGVIEAIEDKIIMEKEIKYYVLRFSVDEMCVMIPVDNAANVGLRYVSSPEVCFNIIKYLNDEIKPGETSACKLFKQNLEKLKTGEISEVAQVIRVLKAKYYQNGLSSGEKRMLAQALTILTSEIAMSIDSTPEEIKDKIVDFI